MRRFTTLSPLGTLLVGRAARDLESL